jgi:phage host-nuclease inhibitor protein Gam
MRNTNEKTITVKREDLLAKLKENKDIHEKEYAELQEAYLDACEQKAKELVVVTKCRNFDSSSSFWERPQKPSCHIEDYEVAIGMFEMEVNDEVVITQSEFEQYVLDKWTWARSFALSKTAYGME